MNLVDKYLVMWVGDAELTSVLVLPRGPSGTEWWLVGAQIKGETPQLGLWAKIESIQDREAGKDLVRDASIQITGVTLLPWSLIQRAQVYDAPLQPPKSDSGNAEITPPVADHDKLANEVHRMKQEATEEKRLDNLSKIVSVTYDKAAAYTNLILIAGYASFFAIWSSTKPVLSSRISMGAIILILLSAVAFIGFETYKMVLNAMFFRRSQAFLTDPTVLQSPQIFQQRLDEYNAGNRRYGLSFVPIWIAVLAVTVPTVVFAVAFLAYNYLSILFHLEPAQTIAGIFASVLGLVLGLLGALGAGLIPYFGRAAGPEGMIVFRGRLWAWSWAAAGLVSITGAGISFLAPH